MTIHKQAVTLTVFSIDHIDPDVLTDSIKGALYHLGAVVDVGMGAKEAMTDDSAQTELWHRGFDPDVLDGYEVDDTDDIDGYIAGFPAYANHQAKLASF